MALLGLAIQMNAQTTEGMKFCKEGTKFAEAVAQAKAEKNGIFGLLYFMVWTMQDDGT